MASKFAFDDPDSALDALAARLATVEVEPKIDIASATGRVLAQPIVADRDSPAADVSAMDGYAIRIDQLQTDSPIRVATQSAPGSPPPSMPPEGVIRIFTGAMVPEGAQAVVKREDTDEQGINEYSAENQGASIRFKTAAMATKLGEHIRMAGENAPRQSQVIAPESILHAGSIATAVNFGCFDIDVFRRVKVAIVTTGDEVGMFKNGPPEPWQLQNSNRFAVRAVLNSHPWIESVDAVHCRDDRDSLREALRKQLSKCDAILMTGGVSMGDYDYVPDVVRELGGDIVFHGLPIRPGKPILGAATKEGKLILGLPGNPVSATIGCRRMAVPLLARISGQSAWSPRTTTVELEDGGEKTLPLHWMRLVKLTADGIAQPVISLGSGDLVSMSQSDGFVELPPHGRGAGPWPFYTF